MAIKVKEIKEDAIIDIKVNKAYYLMLKAALFFLFENTGMTDVQREASLKNVAEKDYTELNDYERTFQTVTRIIGEIEKTAKDNGLYEEKEILEATDEGYVPPTQD